MTIMTFAKRIAMLGMAVFISGCVAQQGPVAYAPAPPPLYTERVVAPAPIRVEPRRYYRPGFGYYRPGYAYDPFLATGSLSFAYFGGRSYDRHDHKSHREDRRRDDRAKRRDRNDGKAKRRGRDLSEEERAARRERRAERRNLSEEERAARRERRAERRAAREAAGEPVRKRAEGGNRNRGERGQRRAERQAAAPGDRSGCGRKGKRCKE